MSIGCIESLLDRAGLKRLPALSQLNFVWCWSVEIRV